VPEGSSVSDDDDDWFEDALDDDSEGESTTDDADDGASTGSPFDDTPTDNEGPFAGTDADDSPFGDAVDTDDTFDDTGAGGSFGAGEPAPDETPWGDEASGENPFEDSGEDGELFDEDFGNAFEASGDDEFSDEDFESDIPRIDLGIEGLDDMIQGGIPHKHLIVTIGSAGTGKTTFGLQFLHHGLENGENSVFITLEQSREAIMATANERGWEFDRYEEENRLAVVDLDPVEMANSLDNIRGELPELIREFDADRIVLDSVSLLEMMYDDQARRRTQVFDFTRSLKEANVTTFLTSEASENNPYASRHGIIEYLTDAVFILQYVRSDTQETRLAVEIQKIRNANHSRAKKPYDITGNGISVYQQANIF